MLYISTRGKTDMVSSAHAISNGLAADGGLFVPKEFPPISLAEIDAMREAPYSDRALTVLARFLTDYSEDELRNCVETAYSKDRFGDFPAPLHLLKDNLDVLELWHGPTCAFKDMALQILPLFLTKAVQKTGEQKKLVILVATSGDTGKAAMAGFADVPETEVIVFYPQEGVSDIQKLQMVTQKGDNVHAVAVEGNFDDAQTGVKILFGSQPLAQELQEHGCAFSSANSINWGRLVPQIVYYFSAYADAVNSGRIENGAPVNFAVPTGNFGDILAGFYARLMGLPVNKFICASNSNNVLTDFLCTGVYDRNRTFYNTMSPSMDILISSNLERLLFSLSNHDDAEARGYMEELARSGRYEVSPAIKGRLEKLFAAGFCDDAQTQKVIGRMWQEHRYLIDPHTAVAFDVLDQYRRDTGDTTPTVVVSTASPFKFCDSVLGALGVSELAAGTAILDQLSQQTGVPVPAPLAALKDKTVRFGRSVTKEHMVDQVLEMLR